jgi:CheY-like chemotaxis protein
MGNVTKGILLVEDEAIIPMRKKQLKKFGYSVSIVASGEGAVQKGT